jgi:hypothetical protein
VCDGLDNDCNAEVDDDAECPPRTACIEAACRPPCDPDEEFPWPVGFSCVAHTDGDFYCLPAACDDCDAGERCREDWTCGAAPCEGVACGQGEACLDGECIEDGCVNSACSPVDVCVLGRGCVPDPCLTVRCPAGQCVVSRVGVPARDAGAVDDDLDDDGDDDGAADATQDRVIASGGGRRRGVAGVACPARPMAPEATMRRALASTWGLWASLCLTAPCVGCEVDTFCLDCPASDDGAADPGAAPPVDTEDGGGQGGGSFDPMDAGADAGPRVCMRSAEELCNGFDDDCAKIVDEGFDLDADPRHCGECGNACAPPNADGYCEGGECRQGDCFDGFADLSDDEPGCEHRCEVFPILGESCNGLDDDCDGEADEADGLLAPPTTSARTPRGRPAKVRSRSAPSATASPAGIATTATRWSSIPPSPTASSATRRSVTARTATATATWMRTWAPRTWFA